MAIAIQETIITKSIRILKTNAGIVTFVGMAARLVTRAIPIATIPVMNNGKLGPASSVMATVIGVRMHP